MTDPATTPPTAAFIARWSAASGSERANYQLFVTELCELLGTPKPDPARDDTRDNAYVFERRVQFAHGDGTRSNGFIDCYQRGRFVLEAKKVRAGAHTKGFDDALLRARSQAESYARALPASEGRPPFLVVVDVGHVIELYAEFSRSGATYTPFPDPRSHRIKLDDLHDERIRERLRTLWLDPLALDPARISAKVTREVSGELATLATSLEASGHAPQAVAAFLTRCLFSMFAEDVALLPERSFKELLERHRDQPARLRKMLQVLWAEMDRGGFSAVLERDVLRFNGKLFKGAAADGYVLPLTRDQIDGLLRAANADWREVEPAIFGTLLERALSTDERHALGAHYTPRAYVERLVLPTVVQPLRADWADAQAAAVLLANEGKMIEARAEVRRFHHQLCTTRVLDPACGSGNFLYVTLEHLKRLEGEVLNQLSALGETQDKLGFAGETVTLQQLLGIEINPRAAALAELVLWIGFLQWHIRTFGNASVAEPVIHDYGNIDCRDAVLAYDRVDYVMDASGTAVTRWDGEHFKLHPLTGEKVPDEAFQTPLEKYTNPRKAAWPTADFIVGNPPFIGSKLMRLTLGDGYVDALQAAWPDVPEATDFVMRWWHKAAVTVRDGEARRFGLITTNTLRQTYVRRAVEPFLTGEQPIVLAFACADHPWVDAADGAGVRIALTVGSRVRSPGVLLEVLSEHAGSVGAGEDAVQRFRQIDGFINSDLTIGADLTEATTLRSNADICSVGMKTIGAAFQIDRVTAEAIGLGRVDGLDRFVRPYINGRDFASSTRSLYVVDFFGIGVDEVRSRFPDAYQHLLLRAKPERDQNRNQIFRERWWVIGHPRPQFRLAAKGLARFIATIETSKHRFFGFLGISVVPDSTLVTVAADDANLLGLLSSRVHAAWSLRAGGTLEDRPRYNKSVCFEPFPFPNLTDQPALAAQIAATAEELDAHRKRQQAAHATLTLTDMYNVLDALRLGRALTAKEKLTHANGLVSVLAELHDRLDTLVLQAYGWSDLAPALVGQPGGTLPWPEKPAGQAAAEEELLVRLVALNAERAAEEARGTVRWLRPEFQNPAQRGAAALPVATQDEMDLGVAPVAAKKKGGKRAAAPTKRAWPNTLPEQMRGVAGVLTASARPIALEAIESAFTGRGPWKRRIPQILDALAALGRARVVNGLWTLG